MIAQISVGDNVLDFAEGTLAVGSSYAVGKSSDSQQPSEHCCTRENDPLKLVDCQNLLGADAIVDAFDSFSIEGLSLRKDEEEKDVLKLDDIVKLSPSCDNQTKNSLNVYNSSNSLTLKESAENVAMEVDGASETKCASVTSSSPLNPSSFENTLDQASWNKRPVRNCRNKPNKKALLDFSSLQTLRRRRSSLSKQARSGAWGLLSNIESHIERNSGTDVIPDNTKRSRAPKVVQGCKQKNKKADHRLKKLRQMKHTTTGIISIKVKFGKQSASTMNVLPVIAGNKGDKDSVSENPSPEDCKVLMEKEATDGVHFLSTDETSERASALHLSFKESKRNVDTNTADDICTCPSFDDVEKEGATDNRALDSGTSPDSEVINMLPDSQISRKDSEGLHHVANGFAVTGNVCGLSLPWQGSEQGRRTDELHEIGDYCLNGEIPSSQNMIKLQEFAKLGEREKMGNGSYFSDTTNSTSAGNTSACACNMVEFYGETVPTSAGVEFGNSCKTSYVERAMEADHSATLGEQLESTDSLLSQRVLPCLEGQKQNKKSKARKMTKSKSEKPNSSSRSNKASKKKVNRDRSVQKGKNKEVAVENKIPQEVDNLPEIGNLALSGFGEREETCKKNPSTKEDIVISSIEVGAVAEKCTVPKEKDAWVSCDDCHKWRRIPAALVDEIADDCRWVCKDNKDKEFAKCAIPQEKSNAEINAELEISDASCEEDAGDLHLTSNKPRRNQSKVNEQSPWNLIKSNIFLRRRRKTQSIDEIMVCGCQKPTDNRMGCGNKCLNRMLNIECIPGTCPCGESCSNQQFQKRKYAQLKSFKCGKKGYGLQLQEDVSEGQFLIEYVGEVLDMRSYEERQRDYAFKGHKHFYFMTLNGSEVIDACAKGNLGRFINHSCDPNCRTEKWMVNGEVCIGIFALRDIKKGEEVTFDYNYVRVFGAAAKICVCGSSQCRGYIGGDPLNSDVIVQGDSDEEYPEPVMVCDDDGTNQNICNLTLTKSSREEKEVMTSKESFKHVDEISEKLCNGGLLDISLDKQTQEMFSTDEVEIDSSITATGHSDITKESRVPMTKSPSIPLKIKISPEEECSVGQHSSQSSDGVRDGFLDPEDCCATEKSKLCSLSWNQPERVSLDAEPEKSLPDIPDVKKKSKPSGGENEVVLTKSRPRTKISGKLLSDKKRKSKTDAGNVKKVLEADNSLHVLSLKSKRLPEDPSNGHFEADRFEAVQQKLNELLDSDGGISKRKDASRGYLKLLLLTAASGDGGNGEAIQSNRDLSMILDALLKTKSRTVLVDVINKNGLQMLHNIMKRYRKEFIKIPILRKLLKVLEYLATREILTSEHINGGPRFSGVESFRDSILTLTEHNDKQVHQIARNFRDRWIPRCFRKYGNMDREDCRVEFHRGLSLEKFHASHNNWNDHHQYTKTPETLAASSTVDVGKLEGSSASQNTRKRKSRWDQPHKGRPGLIAETVIEGDGANNMDEDVPPGFSSPQNGPVPSSDTSSNADDHQRKRSNHEKCPYQVAVGHSQQRFISRISVSYGVPISIVQQFGSPRLDTPESWTVAPGIPFQAFPPLPQYPRIQSTTCTSSPVAQTAEQNIHDQVTSDSSQNIPTTSAMDAPDSETPCGIINESDFQQTRGNLGKRYFRQQKWNNTKLVPPWVRMRNGWSSSGMNARNGMCPPPPGFGGGPIEYNNSQDMSPGVQNGISTHQYPQQHNWN